MACICVPEQALSRDDLWQVLDRVVPRANGGHKFKIRSAIESWAPQPAQHYQQPAAAVSAAATAGGSAASTPAPAPYYPPAAVAATGGGWAVSAPAPAPYSPPGVPVQMPAGGGWGSPAPAPYTPPPSAVTQAVVVDSLGTPAGGGMPVAATVVGGYTGHAPSQAPAQTPPPYNAQPQPQAGMCIQCGKRPVYTDLRTGQKHQYCGKRCAGEAKAGRPPAAAAISTGAGTGTGQLGMPPGGAAPMLHHQQPQQPQSARQTSMCATCGVKPANPPHRFCGRTCAAAQPAVGGGAVRSVRAGGGVLSASIMHPTADPGMCSFCNKRPVVQGHPFCGRSCANIAQQAGWVDGKPPGPAAHFARLEPDLTQVRSTYI
eukprot:COSAG02_NODE_2448_length_8837_cov_38.266880_12_plen_373_part_00